MAVIRWPESRFFTANFGSFVLFALIANILYTAVYLPEALLQIPQLRQIAGPARWCILIAGTTLACYLAYAALDLTILRDPTDD
jgi:hypothetical protein